jgi:SWI/SNF-related matrix-associated actin-dependent regulator 1 of chromatin subfamily A
VLAALPFSSCRCDYIRVDGETPHEGRDYRVDRFQREPKVRLALLSIKVASHGFTLTAASAVVFAELSWNTSDLVQAEDRAHRISQVRGGVRLGANGMLQRCM